MIFGLSIALTAYWYHLDPDSVRADVVSRLATIGLAIALSAAFAAGVCFAWADSEIAGAQAILRHCADVGCDAATLIQAHDTAASAQAAQGWLAPLFWFFAIL